MRRLSIIPILILPAFLFLLFGCSADNDVTSLMQPNPDLGPKGAPSSFGNCLSMPVVWAEGHGLTGEDCNHFTGLRGSFGGESFVSPYDGTLIDGFPVYRNPSENEWQAASADGTALGQTDVLLDWADNMTRQTWTDKSKVRVEVTLFTELATPLMGYNMYSLGGTQLDEVFVTNTTTYPATTATVYSNVARLKIEKLDAEGGVPVLEVYNSPVYERYFVDGPSSAYAAEVNMGGKCMYGFNWNVKDVPLATRSGWYRLTFSLDDQAEYVDYDGVAHVYPRNTLIASLDPADIIGTNVPEVVVYEPQIAADGFSSVLEIYITPGKGGGSNKRTTE